MSLPSPSPSWTCQASYWLCWASPSSVSCALTAPTVQSLWLIWKENERIRTQLEKSLLVHFQCHVSRKAPGHVSIDIHTVHPIYSYILSCLDNRFPVILMNINHRAKWDLYGCSDWDILVLGHKRGWDASRLYPLGSQGKWGLPEAASWAVDSVQVSSGRSGVRN